VVKGASADDGCRVRGGIGFSHSGISGIRAGHNRRNEVHEEPKRNHSAAFKARVALKAIRGEKTVKIVAARMPDLPSDYPGRAAVLIDHGVALLDVLAAATRSGS
jgi:hypothetical protein